MFGRKNHKCFESEYQKAFAWSRGFHMKPYNLNDYKSGIDKFLKIKKNFF